MWYIGNKNTDCKREKCLLLSEIKEFKFSVEMKILNITHLIYEIKPQGL